MDREIAPEYVRTRRLKRAGSIAVVVVVLVAGFYFFRKALGASIEAARIRTAIVESGTVENMLNGSGEVIPAYEQIFTSPIKASNKRILLTPGTHYHS